MSRQQIPALDGLRALAVVAVLAFHDDRLEGGFLGVDLFFVLSGFLITGLLLDRLRPQEPSTLGSFWTQRLRRLTPAVLVLIIVVTVGFRFLADPAEWIIGRRDAPWAQFYGANWHQIWLGTDYWERFATPSPFQHLWSLAIEEQFYLVWPLIVMAVLRWSRAATVMIVSAVGAVGSAALMWILADNATRVYMGTDTRAFSLLIGACLATPPVRDLCAGILSRHRLLTMALSTVSIAIVGVMWCTTNGDSPQLFRGQLIVHAVLSGIIIVTLTQSDGPLTHVLGWRPLSYLGRLSYSLYLWHWPVFTYLTPARTHLHGWTSTGLRLAVTLALSVASYHLIEYPIRYRATWVRHRAGFVTFTVATLVTAVSWLAISIPSTTNAVDVDALTSFVTSVPPTTAPAQDRNVGAEWSNRPLNSVYYFGDSIASDIWPAVDAAFSAAGISIESGAFGGVGLVESHDNVDPIGSLTRRLDEVHPDLLIVQLSVWDAEQPASKQIDALQALRTVTEERHIAVLLVSFPSLISEHTHPGQTLFERRARDLAVSSTGSIAYVDQRPALGSTFEFDVDGDGIPERKRDGVHVCPTGALIVAQWLVGRVSELLPAFHSVPTSVWATGSWRSDARFDSPPGACARIESRP